MKVASSVEVKSFAWHADLDLDFVVGVVVEVERAETAETEVKVIAVVAEVAVVVVVEGRVVVDACAGDDDSDA